MTTGRRHGPCHRHHQRRPRRWNLSLDNNPWTQLQLHLSTMHPAKNNTSYGNLPSSALEASEKPCPGNCRNEEASLPQGHDCFPCKAKISALAKPKHGLATFSLPNILTTRQKQQRQQQQQRLPVCFDAQAPLRCVRLLPQSVASPTLWKRRKLMLSLLFLCRAARRRYGKSLATPAATTTRQKGRL